MLVDPTFQAQLAANSPYTDQSLDFVKNVVKPIGYLDVAAAAGVLTGQVRSGDGVAIAAVTNLLARVTSGTIAVGTGTAQFGAGTAVCWLQTTGAGAFQVTITGSGAVLVEIVMSVGLPLLVPLAL